VFRRILVGFDGSPGARRALHYALQLAVSSESLVWALAVKEPLPRYAARAAELLAESDVREHFERLENEARSEAAAAGVPLQAEAVQGHASQAIVEYARQVNADLIVIGQHGHGGVLDRMLGSTSDRVVDTASCSVLVVPSERHRS